KTRDFYLACFLRAKGLELIEAKEDVYEKNSYFSFNYLIFNIFNIQQHI
ncbi:unnamed protein product, partial [marine sediment metagenome]